MPVRPLGPDDAPAWWALRERLWPDDSPEALREPPAVYRGVEDVAFVWEDDDGRLVGFAEGSLRRYAEDCETTPVGYLEGWYVEPDHRGAGIGRALVAAVEVWARSKGCSEMGSDTWLDNTGSRRAHAALGFREVEVLVHFAKRIGDAAEPTGSSGPDAAVTLREVDESNVRAVCDLAVATHQLAFVAPNAVSLAEAYTTPAAWPRAVYADDEPVGFVMLYDDEAKEQYHLWRFMVDKRHQGKGFARRALELVEDYVRSRPGGDRILLSYVPGPGGPEDFYRRAGYEETGVVHGGEREMAKALR